MFGSGIGIGGLASGLDTNALVQKIVDLESIPIQQLQTKKKDVQSKLALVGQLKGLVTDLQKKANAVGNQSDFLVFDVKASNSDVASFSATGSAAAASHTLIVNQLASIDRWAFDGVSSSTTNLATAAGQTIDFTTNGHAYSIPVDQASSSLENIASQINTTAGADVTATVVNAGTTLSPSYKLVLTSDGSGKDGRIQGLTSTVGLLTIDGTPPDVDGNAVSANNITVGQNAIAVVDGLTVERPTNDLTDVVAGISITAQAADPTLSINFAAEPNKSAIKVKINDLVSAYNNVINFINTQNKYSKDGGAGGALFGDSMLSDVRTSIQKALFDVPLATVQNDTTGYSTLSVIGISSQNDGTLKVDDTKLSDKITNNLSALSDLFVDKDGFDNGGATVNTPEYYTDTTADSGLATSLSRAIDRMINLTTGTGGVTFKGIFDTRNESINHQMNDYDTQIAAKQDYVDKLQAELMQRFANLESVMGGLNSQKSALTASLG
jgi:flagellar hook-associated protein 2